MEDETYARLRVMRQREGTMLTQGDMKLDVKVLEVR